MHIFIIASLLIQCANAMSIPDNTTAMPATTTATTVDIYYWIGTSISLAFVVPLSILFIFVVLFCFAAVFRCICCKRSEYNLSNASVGLV